MKYLIIQTGVCAPPQFTKDTYDRHFKQAGQREEKQHYRKRLQRRMVGKTVDQRLDVSK
jgi:hypothetical protein